MMSFNQSSCIHYLSRFNIFLKSEETKEINKKSQARVAMKCANLGAKLEKKMQKN